MRELVLLAAAHLLSCLALRAQSFTNDTSYYKYIIQTLADDSMKGRAVASIDEDKSAAFIKRCFKASQRIQAKVQTFTFIHPLDHQNMVSKNVYGYINNRASQTLLIGAHYDHIGLGEYRSLSYHNQGEVHNGADDNASGVALLLNLARQYQRWGSKNYNYVFVAYSAHEVGLFGSMAFKQFLDSSLPKVCLVLNFDMVGRMDQRSKVVSIYGYSSLDHIRSYFHKTPQEVNLQLYENDMILQTDAKAFYENGIPSLSFTTGTHLDYHKISDDEQYINYSGMQWVQDIVEDFLIQFTHRPQTQHKEEEH